MRIENIDGADYVVGSKAQWSALLAFTCKDEHRPSLTHVYVGPGEACATDGARLALWTAEKGATQASKGRLVHRNTVDKLLKLADKAEEIAIPIRRDDNVPRILNGALVPATGAGTIANDGDDHTFPDFRHVLTGVGENPSAEAVGVDAALMADVAKLSAFCDGKRTAHMRMVASGQFQPILFEPVGYVEGGNVLGILMPCRL